MNRDTNPTRTASRRSFLGALAATGAVGALAGCSFTRRNEVDPDRDTPTQSATPTRTQTATPTPSGYFDPGPTVGLEPVATGLVSPNVMSTPPDGTDRRFIADQIGTIHVHDADGLRPDLFLDLRSKIVSLGEGLPDWISFDERGLLGLAFHPAFADNGRFYVRYSAPNGNPDIDHNEVLSEFQVTADGTRADPESERVLFDLPWHRPLHQAGAIEFGPDGYLYAALGDGLNPFNGQSLTGEFMGCILRLDVDGRTDDKPYGIPADNPLVGREGIDEMYAWGFRNPWKMSFDGDRLIVGDVGETTWEEVNVVEKGGNYGWPLKEGFHCHDVQLRKAEAGECEITSARGEPLIDPVLEFPHFDEDGHPVGFAVIGGHVHTGSVGSIRGEYLFGAFTSSFTEPAGRLFVASPEETGRWTTRELSVEGRDGPGIQVLSFGTDGTDSYVLGTTAPLSADPLSQEQGVVYRLVEA